MQCPLSGLWGNGIGIWTGRTPFSSPWLNSKRQLNPLKSPVHHSIPSVLKIAVSMAMAAVVSCRNGRYRVFHKGLSGVHVCQTPFHVTFFRSLAALQLIGILLCLLLSDSSIRPSLAPHVKKLQHSLLLKSLADLLRSRVRLQILVLFTVAVKQRLNGRFGLAGVVDGLVGGLVGQSADCSSEPLFHPLA